MKLVEQLERHVKSPEWSRPLTVTLSGLQVKLLFHVLKVLDYKAQEDQFDKGAI